MAKLKLLIGILFFQCLFTAVNAQNSKEPKNFDFRFIKAINNSRLELKTGNASMVKAGKGAKKIQIRFKIKALNHEKTPFDANMLSLVSDTYRVRLRPADVQFNYAVGWIFLPFSKIYINDVKQDSTQIQMVYGDTETDKDTFEQFSFAGYQNINPKINRGTNRRPLINEFYYRPEDLKSCKMDIYFIVPPEFNNGKIYYGNSLLKDFEL